MAEDEMRGYEVNPRRFVIIVDDLERCRPPRAVEVCEVASQLLSHTGVVTILLADMSAVATAAEIKYAKHAEAADSIAGGQSLRSGDPLTIQTGTFGRLYLQKMVQIQFDLPPASLEGLRDLLRKEKRERSEPPSIFERFWSWLAEVRTPPSSIYGRLRSELAHDLGELLKVLFGTLVVSGIVVGLVQLFEWSKLLFAVVVGCVAGFIAIWRTRPRSRARQAARQEASRRLDDEIKRLQSAGVDVVWQKRELMNSDAAKQGGPTSLSSGISSSSPTTLCYASRLSPRSSSTCPLCRVARNG